jgi:hypothetical protein
MSEEVTPKPCPSDLPFYEITMSWNQDLANGNIHSDSRDIQFHHSQASMSSPDSAPNQRSVSAQLGPFQSAFRPPPQPVEVNSSRTLPSRSVSSSTSWYNPSTPGFGGFANYRSPLAVDSQVHATASDPQQQWYTGNDWPWISKETEALTLNPSSIWPASSNVSDMQFGSNDSVESIGVLCSQDFHCLWLGCKARTKTFLLPADLDHHVITYITFVVHGLPVLFENHLAVGPTSSVT